MRDKKRTLNVLISHFAETKILVSRSSMPYKCPLLARSGHAVVARSAMSEKRTLKSGPACFYLSISRGWLLSDNISVVLLPIKNLRSRECPYAPMTIRSISFSPA